MEKDRVGVVSVSGVSLSLEVLTALEVFSELGFDTLPLKPGSKDPYPRGWQSRSPGSLWRDAPAGANIALRCGGEARLAVMDCDEKERPGTFGRVRGWLAGLGYLPGDYPTVQTASGNGRHVYTTFSGDLPLQFRHFSSEFGAGEFRYGVGAFVVAPPSIVSGNGYTLLEGDYRQLPRLTLADVLPILRNQDTTPRPETPSTMRVIPRRAMALLSGSKTTSYKSRSEYEQAIILMLVNAGHSFESVLSLFQSYPGAGKFSELASKDPQRARRWLELSYQKAVRYAENHESKARQMALMALSQLENLPFPGRTGSVDRALLLAHCQIAYKAGKLTYQASARSLAELAGISFRTAARANYRLMEAGYLNLEREAIGDCAHVWELLCQPKLHTTTQEGGRECVTLATLIGHDAFRKGQEGGGVRFVGLPKSCAEVYAALLREPGTIKKLAMRTGRSQSTVRRTLTERLSGLVDGLTGEIVDLVENKGNTWYALRVDLDHVAELVGSAGKAARQQKEHTKDRLRHRGGLTRGRR